MSSVPEVEASEPVAAARLPIGISPAAFRRFVRSGQLVKLGMCLVGVAMLATGRVSALDAALFAGFYVATMLGVTAGMHRLFTHRSFEAHPALRAVLAVLGTMAGQGTVLIWVASHRRHHQHSDLPLDPHSPHGDEPSALGRFWHAHIGWILSFYPEDWERYVPDLLRDPLLIWLHRRSMLVVLLGVVLPGVLAWAFAHTWQAALTGALWGGWVRLFLVEQSVLLVNSAGHLWGRRPFESRDHSVNSWPVAMLTLGEGWHNGHHAFPSSARHGLNRFEPDPTYWAIRLWMAVGLADKVVLPTPDQIEARRRGV
ncbi:MAG: acyl-CoA desaturase [Candidatus Sericytochromatia bacterium]